MKLFSKLISGLLLIIARYSFVVCVTVYLVLLPILMLMTPAMLILLVLWSWVGIREIRRRIK